MSNIFQLGGNPSPLSMPPREVTFNSKLGVQFVYTTAHLVAKHKVTHTFMLKEASQFSFKSTQVPKHTGVPITNYHEMAP